MMRASFPHLSGRDRRTLTAGAGVILTLLVVSRGVPAWRAWVHGSRASLLELSGRLAVARRSAADAGAAARRARSVVDASLALEPALLDGNTPAQATAALAAHVGEAARAAGVRLGAVQLVVDTAAGGSPAFYRVRLTADGTGDVRGVLGLLSAIERSRTPLLSVRTLSVSQLEPAAPGDRAEALHTSFEIEGLARRYDEP